MFVSVYVCVLSLPPFDAPSPSFFPSFLWLRLWPILWWPDYGPFHDAVWARLDLYGPFHDAVWARLDLYGPFHDALWARLDLYGPFHDVWARLDLYGPFCGDQIMAHSMMLCGPD